MDGQLKWYFLIQLAFYLQLLLAINLEERRKDYTQMFSHHVITCALMYVCYAYRYTKIGNVILCIMDVVDILLPVSAMLLLWLTRVLTYLARETDQIPSLRYRLQCSIWYFPCNLACGATLDLQLVVLVYFPRRT